MCKTPVARSPSHLEVRTYLYRKSEDGERANSDLSDYDIDWIMTKEHNQTQLLWKEEGPSNSASGGGTWCIKAGNYVTLAEFFRFGECKVSCYDLYRAYLSMPVFISTRQHSVSHTPVAGLRRNAKKMIYNETGRWALPSRRP